jgi:phage I-like protein
MVIKQLLSRLRDGGRLRSGASASAVAAAALENGLPQTGYLVAAATAEGAAVQRIMLLPIGQVVLRDGRGPFLLADREHAEAVVAASLARAGNSYLMIDYDHQSHFGVGEGKGGRAPAAGWIKNLHADDAGIWADVEWTSAAQGALADREYRYISPLFYAGKDGRVALLRNAGLVNEPAIDALPAIAAAVQETDVNYVKIAAALGLPETATEDDILGALGAAAVGEKPKMVAAAVQFGLDEAADLGAIVAAAIETGRAQGQSAPDPAKFVTKESLDTVAAQLAVREGERADAIIAAASAEGKLTPAQAGWAKGYLASDPAGFDAWLKAAPVIVAAGAMDHGKRALPADLNIVAAANDYIAEQAAKGVTITAAAAVRHITSNQNAGA